MTQGESSFGCIIAKNTKKSSKSGFYALLREMVFSLVIFHLGP